MMYYIDLSGEDSFVTMGKLYPIHETEEYIYDDDGDEWFYGLIAQQNLSTTVEL